MSETSQVVASGNASPFTSMSGRFKFYSVPKGYGFIETEHGDVFLHATIANRHDVRLWRRGGTVFFHAIKTEKGWLVMSIELYDPTTETGEAYAHKADKSTVLVVPDSDWVEARCKFWITQKAYGFVTLGDGGPDILVHANVARAGEMDWLTEGQLVMIRYGNGPRGRIATHVRKIPLQ